MSCSTTGQDCIPLTNWDPVTQTAVYSGTVATTGVDEHAAVWNIDVVVTITLTPTTRKIEVDAGSRCGNGYSEAARDCDDFTDGDTFYGPEPGGCCGNSAGIPSTEVLYEPPTGWC